MAQKMIGRRARKTERRGFTKGVFHTPDIPDYVVAELRYESPVVYTRSRFAASAEAKSEAEGLNQVLSRFEIAAIRNHFGFAAKEVRQRIELAAALPRNASKNTLKTRGADPAF